MKEYNCPGCERTDSCEGCQRLLEREVYKILHVPKYFPDSILWPTEQFIPDCCKNCNNHPSNGGDGICWCILPYMNYK